MVVKEYGNRSQDSHDGGRHAASVREQRDEVVIHLLQIVGLVVEPQEELEERLRGVPQLEVRLNARELVVYLLSAAQRGFRDV